jgi:hypothetical protein
LGFLDPSALRLVCVTIPPGWRCTPSMHLIALDKNGSTKPCLTSPSSSCWISASLAVADLWLPLSSCASSSCCLSSSLSSLVRMYSNPFSKTPRRYSKFGCRPTILWRSLVGRNSDPWSIDAVAADSDFVAMAGKTMLLVKSFVFPKSARTISGRGEPKNAKLSKIILSSGWETVVKHDVLDVLQIDKKQLEGAKYGLFEQVEDVPELRAAIAVGMGCDTLPKGVLGISASTINNFLSNRPNHPVKADDFYDFYASYKTNQLPKQLYITFVYALMYEPATIVGQDDTVYIHQPPTTLPVYLEEFACGNNSVVLDRSFPRLTCCSPAGIPHVFSDGEPTTTCCGCQQVMCYLCVAETKNVEQYMTNEEGKYCLPCFKKELVCGGMETDNGRTNKSMREELYNKYNVVDAATLDKSQVDDLYDCLVTKQRLEVKGLDSIPYPLQSSNFMSDSTSFVKRIDYDFRHGGQFVSAKELSDVDLVGVIAILSELVTFTDLLDTKKEGARRAVPGLLVRIAEGSRIDGGH